MTWLAALPILGELLDRVIPDPQQAADAKIKMLDIAQRGELAALDAETRVALAQAETNKVEAGTDLFRGGWRPAAGWACVFGLVYTFLARPLLPWSVRALGGDVPELPAIDGDALFGLLLGMLGLGTLRTVERVRGKA